MAKIDIFYKTIEDSFGFRDRNGENGTSLDPGSQTGRQKNGLGENLQSTHCLSRLNIGPMNAGVKIWSNARLKLVTKCDRGTPLKAGIRATKKTSKMTWTWIYD